MNVNDNHVRSVGFQIGTLLKNQVDEYGMRNAVSYKSTVFVLYILYIPFLTEKFCCVVLAKCKPV